jgi:RNA polymerase sigma-70 factor (ECF subfamily)
MTDTTRRSLLVRAQGGEESAWRDLTVLYRPLLVGWLRRQTVPDRDLEDLIQEILMALVRYLPSFQHSGQPGAFRSWMRTIAANRVRDYWRAGRQRTPAAGGDDATAALAQLEDPDSDLNRHWDDEHDRHLLRCLLAMVEQEFEPTSLRAFRRLALDGASGADVAQELGISVASAYQAKSRVLHRIRQEAEGLIE